VSLSKMPRLKVWPSPQILFAEAFPIKASDYASKVGSLPYGRLGELLGLPVYDTLAVDTKKSDVRCVTVIAFAGLLAPAYAQWVHPDPRTPRTRDGKPILKAPAPRQDGKPDL